MKRKDVPKFGSQNPKRSRPTVPQARIARQIKTIIGVEPKYFDVAFGYAIPTNIAWGTGSGLSATPQPQIAAGDDIYQRNGRKILLTRVCAKGNVFIAPTNATGTSAASPTTVRLILYRILSGQVATNDIIGLADGTAYGNSNVALGGFQNPATFGAVKICDDQTFHLDVTAAVNNASATTVSQTIEEKQVILNYRPKKPIELQYLSSGAVVPNANSFQVVGLTDSTTFTPTFSGVCRFYYTDA